MRPAPHRAAALAVLLAGACTVGPSLNGFAPAQHPAGARASIRMTHGDMNGELLAVSDSGLFVLHQNEVLRVPYAAIEKATFDGADGTIEHGESPDAATRSQLAMLSRFPQGLTPDLERQLLAAHHQAAVTVVTP